MAEINYCGGSPFHEGVLISKWNCDFRNQNIFCDSRRTSCLSTSQVIRELFIQARPVYTWRILSCHWQQVWIQHVFLQIHRHHFEFAHLAWSFLVKFELNNFGFPLRALIQEFMCARCIWSNSNLSSIVYSRCRNLFSKYS